MKNEQTEKINYDRVMQDEIKTFNGEKKSVLLHTCCGPCSTACIERLKDNFNVTVYFYNPNIEPKEEYLHRKEVQLKLLKELNIPYIDADYDNEIFREKTKGLECEPEGGARCPVCFKIRMGKTAQVARDNGFDYFCTSLTVSPHKNSVIINLIGDSIGEKEGIKFLHSDFKKREGYKRSIELSKEYDLYRQDYCGCLYAKDVVKMNKKGFTLVELLAVIIILGLLITITTTSVLSVTKETKAKMKETQLESLLDASDEYINDVIDGNASITPQVSGASEATSYSGYKFLEYVGSCDYTSATNAKFCYSGTSESGNLTITRIIYYDSSVLSKYIDFTNYKISDTNNLCKLKIEVTVEKNKYDYYQLVSKKSLVRNGITANKCVK